MKNCIFSSLRYATVALALLMTGCTLHEEPELTDNGELGVDPTEVTLNLNLTLNLKQEDATAPSVDGESEYMHRFIVDAYLDENSFTRQVFYENIVSGRTWLSLPMQLKLHARAYRIAVWSDYVSAEAQEDLYYDTATLSPLIGNGSYRGNSEYKDCFYAMQEVDLTKYRDEWQAVESLDVELKRPVCRCELIATDMEKLRAKVEAGEAANGVFTVRVKYSDYLPTGFDVLAGEPCNQLMYMQYQKTFRLPSSETDYFTIGFDYVFCDAEGSRIPVEVEVVDANSVTVARSIIQIPCTPGTNVTLRDNFLTADPALAEDGMNIDPDFDDDIDMKVDII